jgi:hypothetical protein
LQVKILRKDDLQIKKGPMHLHKSLKFSRDDKIRTSTPMAWPPDVYSTGLRCRSGTFRPLFF